MKTVIVILAVLSTGSLTASFLELPTAYNLEVAKERCQGPPPADESYVVTEELPWTQSREELAKTAERLYQSPKRMNNRTYYSPQEDKFISSFSRKSISISPRLIESVTRHIETAIAMGYAEHVIFSDMGHNHILVPNELYKKFKETAADNSLAKVLEFFYDHPRSKFIYHTAEQLDFFDKKTNLPKADRYLQMRFYTRSFLAGNLGTGEIYPLQTTGNSHNTAGSWPGHLYMNGVDIGANKNGCFPYFHRGEIRYFDISPLGHRSFRAFSGKGKREAW